MSKRQGTLGMLISLVIVGLVLVTTSGCDSAGTGGNSDPILSVAPISVPTFEDVNVNLTGSISAAALYRDELWQEDTAYDYVNSFNDHILVRYPNGILSAVQNRVRSGQSTEQPSRFTATGTQGSETWEIRGTMVASTADSRTYIAHFDEFKNGVREKNDVPMVIRFSADYRVLYVTAMSNDEGDTMIVQHDYDTSETIFLGKDTSSGVGIYYDMEHIKKSGAGSLTYRNLIYNTESDTDSELNGRAIMHMIAGTGIIHRVEAKSDADGATFETTTAYLTIGGDPLADGGAQTTLDTALATIDSDTEDDDPKTEYEDRQTVIPEYDSSEFIAAKAAHQAFYPDH